MKSSNPRLLGYVIHGVGQLSGLVDAMIRFLAFCSLLAMLAIITMQIVFRLYFQALPWSEELSRHLLVWTTFLGATMAYRRGAHISVTFLVDSFPLLLRRIIRIGAILASLFFFSVAMWYAVRYMQMQSFQVTASLRLPMPYVYAVMPFAFSVMILHAVHALLLEIFPRFKPALETVTIRHAAPSEVPASCCAARPNSHVPSPAGREG
ncbi:TRAP-type C4-dicarboxylate transport system, small permease component [Desulfonatronum thiosulfatophilum]|uniref:TRAP-type C4-dicarboxylate transport system, small permease component n=1 Tax=Desulfonatronum thiosulfatophilum TaxID=617002 RepID=A0A1G6CWE9_9BACT|nr:TRAP transporter small permease [Desulfonatronum thiosulfatophilum]SDB37199.1 TRAP-type C4-dicarboxylate transport system, small permease component [Desulfonatronum thiosulfatophilum]